MAESLTSDLDQEFTKSKVSNQVAHLFGKNGNRLSEVIARFFSKTTGAQPSIYNKDIKQWSVDLQDVISSLGIVNILASLPRVLSLRGGDCRMIVPIFLYCCFNFR